MAGRAGAPLRQTLKGSRNGSTFGGNFSEGRGRPWHGSPHLLGIASLSAKSFTGVLVTGWAKTTANLLALFLMYYEHKNFSPNDAAIVTQTTRLHPYRMSSSARCSIPIHHNIAASPDPLCAAGSWSLRSAGVVATRRRRALTMVNLINKTPTTPRKR